MINLLPTEEKQNLLEEEKLKLVLILGLIVLFFFMSLSLVFLSIRILISSQVEAEKLNLESKKAEFNKEEIQKFREDIIKNNKIILELSDFYKQKTDLTAFLAKISDLVPSDISLSEISVRFTESGNCQVSLLGFSPVAENLSQLIDNLEKEKEDFSQIYLPPSTWGKTKDIDFNLSFYAKIKNEH
ncbi:MAG: hypothetical protein PHF44_01365 [Candidatus Pacebacteria bacterium]|nr:hypothetical protein [Candidatus Paceibacterota bacterium]